MLCVPPERPLDALTIALLRVVEVRLSELQVEYFVTGAMARDILLYNVHGIYTGRETRDVDLAIAIATWHQFGEVQSRLIESGHFVEDAGNPHRLLYKSAGQGRGYPLDLIPFGEIEQPPASIAWPPEHTFVLNVAGYPDAFASAVAIEIAPRLTVRVASLAGLAILKLFAYFGERDRLIRRS